MAALPYVIGGVGGFLIGGPLGAAAGLGIAKLISGTASTPPGTTATLPPTHQMPLVDPNPIVTLDNQEPDLGPKQGGLIMPEGPGHPPAGQEGGILFDVGPMPSGNSPAIVGPAGASSPVQSPPHPSTSDPIYVGPIGPGDGPGGPAGQGGS